MFYVLKVEEDFWVVESIIVNAKQTDIDGKDFIQKNYIFKLVDKYASYDSIVSDYGYEIPELPHELSDKDIEMLGSDIGMLIKHKNIYSEHGARPLNGEIEIVVNEEEFNMDTPEKFFISEILEEDLEVAEKWLIRVSVIEKKEDEDSDDEPEELISRKLVFELIAKLADDYKEALKLDFEVAKLPILYLTRQQQKILMKDGKFELDVLDHVRRPKEVKTE